MLVPCCEMMRVYGRDYLPGVPESDRPDALVEVWPDSGGAVMHAHHGHSVWIYHCPWCGSSLGAPPDIFPKWEEDPDEQHVEDAAFRDTCLEALRSQGILEGYDLEPARIYRSSDGSLTCRVSGTEPEFGGSARWIRRQEPSGKFVESVILGP